jgi:hypothetical protein
MPSRPRALAGLLSAALAAASIALVGGAAPAAAADAPCTKNGAGDCVVIIKPTGTPNATQTFVVPTGVTSLTADAWGASGSWVTDGVTSVRGGYGGRVKASFSVVPGETVHLAVGSRGSDRSSGQQTTGGGGSFVFYGEGTEIAAGGGGGAYRESESDTGYLGGPGGGIGATNAPGPGGGNGGAAATSTAPGGNGTGPARLSGGRIIPGTGAYSGNRGSGGDGSYGGGAAAGTGGGGGGSARLVGAQLIESAANFNFSDGLVYLTWKAGPGVTTSKLPNATYGSAYSAQLAASGGTAPYTWEATSSMPMWLGLSQDGVLSGTPTSPSSIKTITVKATDAKGVASAPVTLDLNVDKQQQSLAFGANPSSTRVGESWTPTFTTTPPTQVAPTLVATDSGCKVDGAKIVFAKVARCTVTATLPATDTTTDAQAPERVFFVGRGSQTITFTSTPPTGAIVDQGYQPTATSPAGAVTFGVIGEPSNACSLTGDTVRLANPGTCTVTADQAGSDQYEAAPRATQVITVGKGTRNVRITSGAPTAAQVGGPTYTVSTQVNDEVSVGVGVGAGTTNSACTIENKVVTFVHAGTCEVQATVPASARYEASSVTQKFTVGRGRFSATLPTPEGVVVGDTWTPKAEGVPTGAGVATLAVDTSLTTRSACAISAADPGVVLMQHAGICVVRIDHAASTDWEATTTTSGQVPVSRAPQEITWTGKPTAGAAGDVVTLTATASSGLPVSYETDGVCRVSGTTLSMPTAGPCMVVALQTGDDDHNGAKAVSTQFTVAARSTSVSIDAPSAGPVAGQSFDVVVRSAKAEAGTVALSVDGAAYGAAKAVDGAGVATFPVTLTAGNRVVSAVFTPTDKGNAAGSKAERTIAVSTAPAPAASAPSAPAVRDPTITASVSSRKPVSASGWYRRAVTVTFTCTAGSAALKAACPAPVRIGRASTARTVTRTVTALDGGTSTVTVGPLNVDRVAPQVRIVQRDDRAPVCRATDGRSGVASCALRTITTARGVVIVAKAIDNAGNRTVRRVRVS